MTKPLTIEQKKKNKAAAKRNASSALRTCAPGKDEVQPGLPLTPGQMKLNGFNGDQLKATTPLAVQNAANEYFDRKSDVEKAKDKVLFALGRIEAEMVAAGIKVCVVRSMGGESMTCRIKSSSKLEIKRTK